jgi:hypothetical protein
MSKIFRPAKSSELSAAPVNGFSKQSTDPTLLENDPGPRELAHRSDYGLEVTMLWHPARDELTVWGSDHRTGARFEIRPQRHLALEVYYHPYRYVTRSDISYEDYRLVEPSTSAGAGG